MASLGAVNANATDRDGLSVGSGTQSRPETPSFARSRPNTPSPRGSVDFGYSTQLRSDNDFLRGLVNQIQREKNILADTIDGLRSEKSQLAAQVENMEKERTTLLEEREALQATIRTMQFPTGVNHYAQQGIPAAMRSPSAVTFPSQNPWGAIGSGTRGNTIEPDTPVDSPVVQPRSFSYAAPNTLGLAGSMGMNGNNSGPNSNAPTNGSAIRFPHYGNNEANGSISNNNSSANGVDGTRVQNVLRHLGPSF